MPDDLFDLGDLEPKSVSYKIGGKPYQLREASSAAAAKFRNASISGAKLADGKIVGIGNVGDVEPLLVSLCLFQLGTDGVWATVPLDTIKSWPARIVKPLFEMAKEISQLDDAREPPPGKAGASATDSTSASP
jgi:hypothetical protein